MLRVVVLFLVLLSGCVDRHVRHELAPPDQELLSSPAMHLVLCGTGSALPDRSRFGPCSAIAAGGQVVLVDVGPGAFEGTHFARVPLHAIETVFLTTFLAENIGDLGEVMIRGWIAGRLRPLQVYGPPGTARLVERVVDAYRFDVAMRTSRHDPEVLNPRVALAEAHEFRFEDPSGAMTVYEKSGLRVTAFSLGTVNEVPVVGYRFDYRNRSVVIAGHVRAHENVARYASGSDLLVHEAADPEMIGRGIRVMRELGDERLARFSAEMVRSFASPTDVARLARAVGVGRLVFSRVYPPLSSPIIRWAFLRKARAIFPDATIGEDGMSFRLDAKP